MDHPCLVLLDGELLLRRLTCPGVAPCHDAGDGRQHHHPREADRNGPARQRAVAPRAPVTANERQGDESQHDADGEPDNGKRSQQGDPREHAGAARADLHGRHVVGRIGGQHGHGISAAVTDGCARTHGGAARRTRHLRRTNHRDMGFAPSCGQMIGLARHGGNERRRC